MVWCVSSEITYHKFEAHTIYISNAKVRFIWVCRVDILLAEIRYVVCLFCNSDFVRQIHTDIRLTENMFSKWVVDQYV